MSPVEFIVVTVAIAILAFYFGMLYKQDEVDILKKSNGILESNLDDQFQQNQRLHASILAYRARIEELTPKHGRDGRFIKKAP
jgi:Tfp pilus assembly protein PilO